MTTKPFRWPSIQHDFALARLEAAEHKSQYGLGCYCPPIKFTFCKLPLQNLRPKSKSFLKSELQTCNGYVDYRFAVCRNNDERRSKTLY